MDTALDHRRAAPEDIEAALIELRAVVGAATYPFDLAGAAPARAGARELATQLDDYLIPRVRRLDAPLLAVVGGSTGAGKSTLVNSLVRAPVSKSGVLRPTTRGPVLVCHPADGAWFGERSLLAGLARSTRPGEQVLQVVSAPYLRPGIALLDAPDIDSVVAANRDLAGELLAAADLWLFVTTAARYADAVPWAVLHGARDRGTVVAVVLDRIPEEARDAIGTDFARMLTEQQLGSAPLFVITESTLDGHGLLPESESRPVKAWLDSVANSASQRRGVTRRTLLGAVAAAGERADALAWAADDQSLAAATAAGVIREAYGRAMSDVEGHIRAGALLRGLGYARWRELIVNGELRQALKAAQDSSGRAGADSATAGGEFQTAIATAMAALIVEADVSAAEETASRWRRDPAGRQLLAAHPELVRPWSGFADAADDLVQQWQQWLRGQVRSEATAPRAPTRARGTGATVLLATVAAVAPPAAQVTGSGTAPAMLREVLAHPIAAALGADARAELLVGVGDLLATEVGRRLAAIRELGVDPGLATALRERSAQVGVARHLFTAASDAA